MGCSASVVEVPKPGASKSSPGGDGKAEAKKGETIVWKVPYWQSVQEMERAEHRDGPLAAQDKKAYLQKRAGGHRSTPSKLRWNIRWFELKEGKLRWWRPDFLEQIRQPQKPRVSKPETRGRAARCLDLTRLQSVTKTKAKFPYSTRILLRFDPEYTKYQLELRVEREYEILEWYSIFCRFCNELYEVELPSDVEEAETATGASSQLDDESGDEDAYPELLDADQRTCSPP